MFFFSSVNNLVTGRSITKQYVDYYDVTKPIVLLIKYPRKKVRPKTLKNATALPIN